MDQICILDSDDEDADEAEDSCIIICDPEDNCITLEDWNTSSRQDIIDAKSISEDSCTRSCLSPEKERILKQCFTVESKETNQVPLASVTSNRGKRKNSQENDNNHKESVVDTSFNSKTKSINLITSSIPLSSERLVNIQNQRITNKETLINGKETLINGKKTLINRKETLINGKEMIINGKKTLINRIEGLINRNETLINGKETLINEGSNVSPDIPNLKLKLQDKLAKIKSVLNFVEIPLETGIPNSDTNPKENAVLESNENVNVSLVGDEEIENDMDCFMVKPRDLDMQQYSQTNFEERLEINGLKHFEEYTKTINMGQGESNVNGVVKDKDMPGLIPLSFYHNKTDILNDGRFKHRPNIETNTMDRLHYNDNSKLVGMPKLLYTPGYKNSIDKLTNIVHQHIDEMQDNNEDVQQRYRNAIISAGKSGIRLISTSKQDCVPGLIWAPSYQNKLDLNNRTVTKNEFTGDGTNVPANAKGQISVLKHNYMSRPLTTYPNKVNIPKDARNINYVSSISVSDESKCTTANPETDNAYKCITANHETGNSYKCTTANHETGNSYKCTTANHETGNSYKCTTANHETGNSYKCTTANHEIDNSQRKSETSEKPSVDQFKPVHVVIFDGTVQKILSDNRIIGKRSTDLQTHSASSSAIVKENVSQLHSRNCLNVKGLNNLTKVHRNVHGKEAIKRSVTDIEDVDHFNCKQRKDSACCYDKEAIIVEGFNLESTVADDEKDTVFEKNNDIHEKSQMMNDDDEKDTVLEKNVISEKPQTMNEENVINEIVIESSDESIVDSDSEDTLDDAKLPNIVNRVPKSLGKIEVRCKDSKNSSEENPQKPDATKESDKQSKKFKCDICGFTFKEELSLNFHMIKHNGDTKFYFPCDLCGKSCLSKEALDKHMLNIHNDQKVAQAVCSICGKMFYGAVGLKQMVRHKKTQHGEFNCCNQVFKHKKDLLEHQKNDTIFRKRYRCCKCDKSYSRLRNLTRHEKTKHSS